MSTSLRCSLRLFIPVLVCRSMSSGAGSGAGKCRGSGGSVRDAGGAFGKRDASEETRYFRKAEADLLAKLKEEHRTICSYHDDEITFHEEAIESHKQSIERHERRKRRLTSNIEK